MIKSLDNEYSGLYELFSDGKRGVVTTRKFKQGVRSNGQMVKDQMIKWSNGQMIKWSNDQRSNCWRLRQSGVHLIKWGNGQRSNGQMIKEQMVKWSN